MLTITDERPDYEKRLRDLWPSDFFIYNDEVYRRIEDNICAQIRSNEEGISCVHQRSGDLVIIDGDAWVMPCRCELHVTE